MKRHLNTLFLTTEDAWLTKQGDSVVVRIENETRMQLPLQSIGGVVCFGRVIVTQPAIALCAAAGVPIAMLSRTGRFLARITGPTSGNVLLRRQQYRQADCGAHTGAIARNVVAGKIANARAVLMRFARDYPESAGIAEVGSAVRKLSAILEDVGNAQDTNAIRGLEGDGAGQYFAVFDHLITAQKEHFRFTGRSRRPPLDRVNALLSFLYALLTNDAVGACEAVGLDPQVGFLHRDRPGRPSLALDLVEELRAFLADRLALSLINRKQVGPGGFEESDSGAVRMDDKTRRAVIAAYQKRKLRTVTHPFLNEKTTIGLIVHLQARLLARQLRGELDSYPPFLWK